MSPTVKKSLKWVAIVLGAYVLLVVAFESLLGIYQPGNASTMTITTTDADGEPHPRVVARLNSGGRLYVAANHWPRAWYRQALAEPALRVDLGDGDAPYEAVPVLGEEFARVDAEHSLGWVFRFITGFPPRRLMRLEPLAGE